MKVNNEMLSRADLLFPKDLSVTDTGIKSVLMVGDCGAVLSRRILLEKYPHIKIDFVSSNGDASLPGALPSPAGEYDFMFVHLALRDFVTDHFVRYNTYLSDIQLQVGLLMQAKLSLRRRLDNLLSYNRQYSLLTIVSNFAVPIKGAHPSLKAAGGTADLTVFIEAINAEIVDITKDMTDVYISDWNALSGALGRAAFSDDMFSFYSHGAMWDPREMNEWDSYRSHERINVLAPVEHVVPSLLEEAHECLWRQWNYIVRVVRQIDAVKLVIFDLDDTLWRGQIGEHYNDVPGDDGWPVFHGWPLGLWEAIHHLRARGILFGLSSKNEEEVVLQRWDRAVMSRWIAPADFIFRKINWSSKDQNVREIIASCSLTPPSVVFVDDNPAERAAISNAIPGIRVIGSDPRQTRRILLWSSETQIASTTDVTLEREAMIASRQKRQAFQDQRTPADFIRDLECRVNVQANLVQFDPRYVRAFELLNKTNQFNTTGKRWTGAQIKEYIDDGGEIIIFSATDRFTEHGIIGVILFKAGCFDQVVMSCRVIGLGIAEAVVEEVVHRRPFDSFSAYVVESDLNFVSRDLFLKVGFSEAINGVAAIDKRALTARRARELSLVFDE